MLSIPCMCHCFVKWRRGLPSLMSLPSLPSLFSLPSSPIDQSETPHALQSTPLTGSSSPGDPPAFQLQCSGATTGPHLRLFCHVLHRVVLCNVGRAACLLCRNQALANREKDRLYDNGEKLGVKRIWLHRKRSMETKGKMRRKKQKQKKKSRK